MTIRVPGTLVIRTIHGRNGPFNVGRLNSEIGTFSIKDALIDQYDEGTYEGDFGISEIFPSHYLAGGRLVVEVRARLASISLSGIDEQLPETDPETEPDPIDEAPAPAPKPELQSKPEVEGEGEAVEPSGADAPSEGEHAPAADADAELFGHLWPLGNQVKLDPTVDRTQFRKQRDWLKAAGYKFQPVGQLWAKAETDIQSE